MTKLAALWAQLRHRYAMGRDLREWRGLLAPLRAVAPPRPTKTVLFCDLMTMPATAKVEALFAGLLRLKGYAPLVLLERPDRTIERIFRAAAPETEFVYRTAGITPADTEAARQAAEAIMAEHQSLQSLVRLELDGYRIGRNVQSKVLRQFRVGRLDDGDPKHREMALATLATSLATKAFAQRLLAAHKPDIAVFVERGYTPAGEVFDGCVLNGVDVMQWCGAPQSDCLIYRRYDRATRAEHPLTLSEEMWARLLAMPWSAAEDEAVTARIAANYASGAWYNRQQLQDGKSMLPADEARRALGIDPSKKTAVIFCHILYDATFFYGDSLFDDYEQWTVETVRAAIANPQLNWVVKVHPVNVWRSRMDGAALAQIEATILRKHFGDLPPHVRLMPADTGINTASLFDIADYGLTVRGTIGMELPCFGIPVVTAGTGRYSGRGFTLDPKTRDEYVALLARLQEVPRLSAEQVSRARLHYYGALELRPVPMQSFMLDYRSSVDVPGMILPNVFMKRRADAHLLDSEDLGRLVAWLTSSRTRELLAGGRDA